MSRNLWIITFVFIIGLHVAALVVAIMSMLFIHRYDRSDAFKDTLLAFSGITLFFGLGGAVLVFTGLGTRMFGDGNK